MGTEKKRESWGWIAGAEVQRREHRECMAGDPQTWASVASETFLYISIQMLPPFCADAFYCLHNNVQNLWRRIQGLPWTGLKLPFPFSLPLSPGLHTSLSAPSLHVLLWMPFYLNRGPFIWIHWPLSMYNYSGNGHFMTSNPFPRTTRQKMCGGFTLSRVICGNRCYLAICDCLLDSWSALRRATLLLTASCKKRDRSH